MTYWVVSIRPWKRMCSCASSPLSVGILLSSCCPAHSEAGIINSFSFRPSLVNSVLASHAVFFFYVATHTSSILRLQLLWAGDDSFAFSFQVVKWVGLESSFGSTGFDKRVDKNFDPEERGNWEDIAKWWCDGGRAGEKIVQQIIHEEWTTMV